MPTSNETMQTVAFTESDTSTAIEDIRQMLRTLTVKCDAEDAEQINDPRFRQILLAEAIRDKLTAFIECGIPLVQPV